MHYPRHRSNDIHGVLLLDKHQGVSSNNALQQVKRLLNINKAGYIGTLDPLATGMLPICFGEATKFSQYLTNSDKRYRVIACLGKNTNTSDANGSIVNIRPITFSHKELDIALQSFIGKTLQVPSIFSAIKYKGRKLYEYARQNIKVELKARPIFIYELLFIRWEKNELELEIHCSKGTYIRTIIDNLGEKLGCGAHVTMLRRLQVSCYPVEKMITLDQLNILLKHSNGQVMSINKLFKPLLFSIDSAVLNFPEINLQNDLAICFKYGKSIQITGHSFSKRRVRITEGNEHKFIGMAEIDTRGYVISRRLVRGGQY